MAELSVVDRIELYATTGMAVTLTAPVAKDVARALRAADEMASRAEAIQQDTPEKETALARWERKCDCFVIGALWAFAVFGVISWGLSL